MRKLGILPGLAAILLLGGCLPSFGTEKEEVIQENEESIEETVMIPDVQLKEEFYKTPIPFKKSASRGLIVSNIYTKYDMQEAEEGLLRISNQHFNPKNHYFQEGQHIDKETARAWLSRSSANEAGLNPPIEEGMSEDTASEVAPNYLAHIVEQNYLVMTDEKKVRLAGISVGLALNSISYSRSGKETKITDKVLEQQGMKMAEEVVRRFAHRKGYQISRLLSDCLNKKAATPSFLAHTLRQLSLEKGNRHRQAGKKLMRSMWCSRRLQRLANTGI